jgi:hypothetical protein
VRVMQDRVGRGPASPSLRTQPAWLKEFGDSIDFRTKNGTN